MCFEESNCAKAETIQMTAVEQARNMESYRQSGFVGLAPTSQAASYPGFITQTNLNFGVFLSNNPLKMGAIVFENDLTTNLETYAQVGKTKDDIVWLNLSQNKYYWTTEMNQLSFGDKEVDIEGTDLIFDTGMSFGIIPINDYNKIVEHLQVNHGCNWYIQSGYHFVDLTAEQYESLPDLRINFWKNDEETVQLAFPKESYLYGSNGQYLLAMSGSNFEPFGKALHENYWILGV